MNLPQVKKKLLTERFTVPVDRELKEALEWLKQSQNVNTSEWIRQLLRRELNLLKENQG